jgi:hypothetical protein
MNLILQPSLNALSGKYVLSDSNTSLHQISLLSLFRALMDIGHALSMQLAEHLNWPKHPYFGKQKEHYLGYTLVPMSWFEI